MINLTSEKTPGMFMDNQFNLYQGIEDKQPVQIYMQKYTNSRNSGKPTITTNFLEILNSLIMRAKKVKKHAFYVVMVQRRVLISANINTNRLLLIVQEGSYSEDELEIQITDEGLNLNIPNYDVSPFLTNFREAVKAAVHVKNKSMKSRSKKSKTALVYDELVKQLYIDFKIKFERGSLAYKYAINYLQLIRECLTDYVNIIGSKKLLLLNKIVVDNRNADGGFCVDYSNGIVYIKLAARHLSTDALGTNYTFGYNSIKETLYHELGHLFEYTYNRCRTTEHSSLFKEGIGMVYKDTNVNKMIQYYTNTSMTLEQYKNSKGKDEFLDYLLDSSEMFARGFSQCMLVYKGISIRDSETCTYLSNPKVCLNLIKQMQFVIRQKSKKYTESLQPA